MTETSQLNLKSDDQRTLEHLGAALVLCWEEVPNLVREQILQAVDLNAANLPQLSREPRQTITDLLWRNIRGEEPSGG